MKPVQKKPNTVRVLLMEDQVKVAELIRLHLQNRAFTVEIAKNGDEGLKMCHDGSHDVLIVDHKMPGRSGLDVIRELKSRGPLPPIIMLSGLGIDIVAVEALKLGVMDYVVKDAEAKFLQTLPVTITEGLKRHREQEEMRKASEEKSLWLTELQQRLSELGCLYGIEKLLEIEGE